MLREEKCCWTELILKGINQRPVGLMGIVKQEASCSTILVEKNITLVGNSSFEASGVL
jgi:hypothetical protein